MLQQVSSLTKCYITAFRKRLLIIEGLLSYFSFGIDHLSKCCEVVKLQLI